MLILNYDDIQERVVPLWEFFLEEMDRKKTSRIGPEGAALEKTKNFSALPGVGSSLVPLIEAYLSDDNPIGIEHRQQIFVDSVVEAEDLGLFEQLQNHPDIFSWEQSHAHQRYQHNVAELNALMAQRPKRRWGADELDMNVFFDQYKRANLKTEIDTYTQGKKIYALLDPQAYLCAVAKIVIAHSTQQCLKIANNEVEVEVEPVDVVYSEPLRLSSSRIARYRKQCEGSTAFLSAMHEAMSGEETPLPASLNKRTL